LSDRCETTLTRSTDDLKHVWIQGPCYFQLHFYYFWEIYIGFSPTAPGYRRSDRYTVLQFHTNAARGKFVHRENPFLNIKYIQIKRNSRSTKRSMLFGGVYCTNHDFTTVHVTLRSSMVSSRIQLGIYHFDYSTSTVWLSYFILDKVPLWLFNFI